jgi:Ser/Thr protein kinase RdoA (MazF antagonist)
MTEKPTDKFTAGALARVEAFIAEHEGITLEGVEQPRHGATNRVFFARRGEDLVVFKVFCQNERKERECFALRHWASTGLVPELLHDCPPDMIVTTHVPGTWLTTVRAELGEPAWREASRATGEAIGRLASVPLSAEDRAEFESRFYEYPTLESYIAKILELSRGVHERDPDFGGGFWRTSLDFMVARVPRILAQSRLLYQQDVANLYVRGEQFSGFFDLEMCRVGCAAMQLASAMGMAECDMVAWDPFREGWESGTGTPLTADDAAAACAARQLLGWREITRYLSYDGTPGTGYAWASPADPERYRSAFAATAELLGSPGG